MRDYGNPAGVDFGEVTTTAPAEAALTPGGDRSHFGVENNKIHHEGSETGLSLDEKAQLDLAGKVKVQKAQFSSDNTGFN